MLLRALLLSSNAKFFQSEVAVIRNILLNNSYPPHMIDELTRKFISLNEIGPSNFKRGMLTKIDRVDNSGLNKIYFKMPYFGKPSRTLQRRLRDQFSNFGIDIHAAFSTTKVASYFCLKSQCSILFKADVVYKFTCSRDENISYIGETRRQLFTRVSEHCTGKDKNSAVFQHLYDCIECQNSNLTKNFQIIQTCDKFSIYSVEAILIAKYSPKLNIQLGPGKGKMITLSLYN